MLQQSMRNAFCSHKGTSMWYVQKINVQECCLLTVLEGIQECEVIEISRGNRSNDHKTYRSLSITRNYTSSGTSFA
jgi:hypothetical protein